MNWKKGRGKLGILQPLLGKWITNEGGNSQSNPQCVRTFKSVLNHKYIELKAEWQLTGSVYEDITFIGVNSDKDISFWSFTSYGKESKGTIADVSDIHPEAIGFEAMMPAGLARQAYWPDEENGFHWAVESKNKRAGIDLYTIIIQHIKPNNFEFQKRLLTHSCHTPPLYLRKTNLWKAY